MKQLLFALALLSMVSCNVDRHKINRVMGEKVSLESLSRLLVTKDSLRFVPAGGQAYDVAMKLCYYVDSTKCFGCQLKWLENLRPYYKLEDDFEGLFSVYLIVSPTEESKKEVSFFLRSLFPKGQVVYQDKSHKFYRDNKFLNKDERFNMFLLDRDNRIICVGNSLMGNRELDSLYIKRIKEELKPAG